MPVGGFSFYEQVLDTCFVLSHIPSRLDTPLEDYFRKSQVGGRDFSDDSTCSCIHISEISLIPMIIICLNLTKNTAFNLNSERLLAEIKQAKQ